MRQVARNYKSGELAFLDAPAPVCRPGGVLVQSLFSLISTGRMTWRLPATYHLAGSGRGPPLSSSTKLETSS
jgi:hypothetical protein